MKRLCLFYPILLVIVAMFMQGCASIVSKSEYIVSIASEPSEATVTVENRDGKLVFTGTTPAQVTLQSAADVFIKGSYTITFEKEGYTKKVVSIVSKIDGWYVAGNFFFGGLLGWLIIDPVSGAMWTLRDNQNVHADLTATSSLPDDASTKAVSSMDVGLRVMAYNDLSEDMKYRLVRLN